MDEMATVEYQVSARRFRPKRFQEVVGQEAIVTTLQNALKKDLLAHAYLFAGSRGTGKTTLARLLAKAINCPERSSSGEPCTHCASCVETQSGSSLDVLEIDGASHRSIEDIRQIHESVNYLPSRGKCKIYIIDEVHMLTKEAFNALLKTLEEPPPSVKFLFATTEPNRIPATILSRCQRFHLQRLAPERIFKKLSEMAQVLEMSIEEEALQIVARLAEGSLRDAQSLFDQVMTCEARPLTATHVYAVLGLVAPSFFFDLDEAVSERAYEKAFALAGAIFASGKQLSYFISELTMHFRTLLLIKVGSEEARGGYGRSVTYYTEEQLLDILEMLSQSEQRFKGALSERVALEMLFFEILRIQQRIPLTSLVQRLEQLEKKGVERAPKPPVAQPKPEIKAPSKEAVAQPKPEGKAAPKEAVPQGAPLELSKQDQAKQETLMRFAAKELGGLLRK